MRKHCHDCPHNNTRLNSKVTEVVGFSTKPHPCHNHLSLPCVGHERELREGSDAVKTGDLIYFRIDGRPVTQEEVYTEHGDLITLGRKRNEQNCQGGCQLA